MLIIIDELLVQRPKNWSCGRPGTVLLVEWLILPYGTILKNVFGRSCFLLLRTGRNMGLFIPILKTTLDCVCFIKAKSTSPDVYRFFGFKDINKLQNKKPPRKDDFL